MTKVKSVIYDVISQIPEAMQDPEPKVYVSNHLDSGVEILTLVWSKSEDYFTVKFKMEENVKNAFDENGITIPYPHVTVMNK